MTYEAQNVSVHDSQPIEGFKFASPVGSHLYCNSPEPITIDGEVYTPLAGISRSAIEVGVSLSSPMTIDIMVPFDSEVAVEHGYLVSPDQLTIEIRRVERGTDFDTDFKLIWQGSANGFEATGRLLSIKTGSVLQNEIGISTNSVFYLPTCNHDLYDARCKVNKATHTETSTVTVIGEAAITVVDDGFADHALLAGEVKNNRTGERRLIVDNLANVLTLAYGFTDILVGDEVDIVRGCLHNSADCINTFDNFDNYGGFRHIPDANPYETGLDI